MTDPTHPADGLGPPPQPEPARRERSIADALAHFDDLIVDGALTSADRPDADELTRRRRSKGRPRAAPQRWLVAAAAVLVIGVGGVVVAQLVEGSAEQTTSQASDQAESGAAKSAERGDAGQAEADQGVPDQAGASAVTNGVPTTVAAPALAPEAADAPPESLPPWLCELTERLGVGVCGP